MPKPIDGCVQSKPLNGSSPNMLIEGGYVEVWQYAPENFQITIMHDKQWCDCKVIANKLSIAMFEAVQLMHEHNLEYIRVLELDDQDRLRLAL